MKKKKKFFINKKKYTNTFLDDKTKFIEIKETDDDIKFEKKSSNRRVNLTEEEIREERRRLQERAMKFNQTTSKHVHFDDNQMDVDSDDDEVPSQQFNKIFIHHTKTDSEPIGDSSSALFPHPGAIGKTEPIGDSSPALVPIEKTEPMAFTGKTIEREVTTHVEPPPPPKRISKFKASRQ